MSFPIIIVSGLPGTGKSYLTRQLSAELAIPVVSKDGFKELLFDTLGYSTREWSKKLGSSSMRLLDYVLVAHLEAESPLIIESNFKPEFENERFRSFGEKYGATYIQILCHANGEVLIERFRQRAESGERHPGHDDLNNQEEFREVLSKGRIDLLDVPGERIEVDTTSYELVDYPGIVARVRSLIA
jgi:predicted kinase